MLRSITRLLLGVIFALVVGLIIFAIYGLPKLILTEVTCNLQTNNTYTCTVKEIIWGTQYQLATKQVENVSGIQSSTSNRCKRNCARQVEFQLTSGEITPLRNHYGDSELAQKMVKEITEKMENKDKVILYTSEINRVWDLYFPISITVLVAGAIFITKISEFFEYLRLKNKQQLGN